MNQRKSNSNHKLFIAIGIAVILGLVLINIVTGFYNQAESYKRASVAIQKDKDELQKELNRMKKKLLNEQRIKKRTLAVVVAKHPVKSGTMLKRSDLEVKEWVQDQVPMNAANYPDILLGRIVSKNLVKGEVILPDKLIKKK